jgi:hypothetical protein
LRSLSTSPQEWLAANASSFPGSVLKSRFGGDEAFGIVTGKNKITWQYQLFVPIKTLNPG